MNEEPHKLPATVEEFDRRFDDGESLDQLGVDLSKFRRGAEATAEQAGIPPVDEVKVPQPKVRKPRKRKETKADRLQAAAQGVLDAVEEAIKSVADAQTAYEAAQAAYQEAADELAGTLQGIEDALQELKDVRENEYQGWYDNMNEGLQQSPTGQKLSELLEIDLDPSMPELAELPEFEEPDFSEIQDAAQSILDADLPQGFGRD